MVDLGTYKDRFGETGQNIFEHAMRESKRRDQNYVAVEHILHAFVTEEGDMFDSTMRDLSLDPYAVRALILVLVVATFFAAGGERIRRITAAFDWMGVVPVANYRVDAWVTPPPYTARPPICKLTM